jgi:acyl dehydratase
MPIDPQRLLATPPIETRHRLNKRDTMLYALAIGADELHYVYEDGLVALPTMAVVLAYPGFIWRDPALGADWRRILHGEQSIEIHRPLPVEGSFIGLTRIEAVADKGFGKGAVVTMSRTISSDDGTLYAIARMTTFLRGDGGCGSAGPASPPPAALPADRAPDIGLALPTATNQAMLYRLLGDDNPLHIDPAVARAGGFDRPILHGLCSYGVVGRALLEVLCDTDPARLTRIDARFSAPVYPGETIATEIWRLGPGEAAFRARVVERDIIVLTNGFARFTAS